MKAIIKNKKDISMASINKWLLICNIVLFGLFLSLQIGITSVIGTKSSEIEYIRKQKDDVRLQIEIVQSQIDQAKSYENLEEIVEAQSLVKKTVVFIDDTPNEIAQR